MLIAEAVERDRRQTGHTARGSPSPSGNRGTCQVKKLAAFRGEDFRALGIVIVSTKGDRLTQWGFLSCADGEGCARSPAISSEYHFTTEALF